VDVSERTPAGEIVDRFALNLGGRSPIITDSGGSEVLKTTLVSALPIPRTLVVRFPDVELSFYGETFSLQVTQETSFSDLRTELAPLANGDRSRLAFRRGSKDILDSERVWTQGEPMVALTIDGLSEPEYGAVPQRRPLYHADALGLISKISKREPRVCRRFLLFHNYDAAYALFDIITTTVS
jgi:hypothetical protein